MPGSLGQWVRDLRQKLRRRTQRDGEPELPYLCPYPLASLTAAAPSTSAIENSAFFTQLPLEIREKVLIAAFGDRTLHMDLRLGPPLLPVRERPTIPSTLQRMPHGGVTADLEYGQWPKEVLDAARQARVAAPETKPVWQWWGYTEGIRLLYSTNTIFIESRRLIIDLLLSAPGSPLNQRVLVPPNHLAYITRLELVWGWTLFTRPEYAEQQNTHRTDMVRSLDLLPRAFPNLVSIFISYSDNLYRRNIRPEEFFAEVDSNLLAPHSEMATRLTRLEKCIVELPTNTFRPLMARAEKSGNKIDKGRSWQDVRFWWEPGRHIDENGAKQQQQLQGSRIGFWVKWGVESDLSFDYLGQPTRLSTAGHTLL
ncbi:hypothetical protein GQ53DRAFT_778957 [Thozetella sp. PMI_491]|nr:hypothetical protein GQ53DRAFT_778957 [Thozetella sp. PMI_491]